MANEETNFRFQNWSTKHKEINMTTCIRISQT